MSRLVTRSTRVEDQISANAIQFQTNLYLSQIRPYHYSYFQLACAIEADAVRTYGHESESIVLSSSSVSSTTHARH